MIKANSAIHCPKKEYVEPILKAANYNDIEKGLRNWERHKEETCFFFPTNRHWESDCIANYLQKPMTTILNIKDVLTIPDETDPIRAALLAVNLYWIEKDVPFMFNGNQIIIQNGRFFSKPQGTNDDWYADDTLFTKIIKNPEKTKLCEKIKWTPDEAQMAIADHRRFNYVLRTKSNHVYLSVDKPVRNEQTNFYDPGSQCLLITNDYPSLPIDRYESLKTIANMYPQGPPQTISPWETQSPQYNPQHHLGYLPFQLPYQPQMPGYVTPPQHPDYPSQTPETITKNKTCHIGDLDGDSEIYAQSLNPFNQHPAPTTQEATDKED